VGLVFLESLPSVTVRFVLLESSPSVSVGFVLLESSPPVFSGVRVTRSLVLYVCFVDNCLSFCPFHLAIVLSVLRITDSDYSFGIYKLFFGGDETPKRKY
jgi:hypothetical protein